MALETDTPAIEILPPPDPDQERDIFVFLMMHELVVISALLDQLDRREG